MSITWWLDRLRRRDRDRAEALQRVAAEAGRESREQAAEYDTFVNPARRLGEGLAIGEARSSCGEAVPIRLPWGGEYVHWLVQGGTGTGKTTWVASLLHQELSRGRPFGLIDCKGDLFRAAIRLAAAHGATLAPPDRDHLRDRLVVINPFSDALVPLNVCAPLPGCPAEVQAYEMALALSRLFDSALGLHMESILRHLLLLLMEARLSLVEAPLVLQDDLLRGLLATRSTNPAVKEFFLGTWSVVPQPSKDALAARLQALLLPENLRLMLGAEGIIDLRGVLDRGDPLFIFLGKGPGVPEEQVEVLGSLVLQLLLQATYARGSGAKGRYLLAVDEFFHILEAPALGRRFETALTTVRAFGLSLMLIHHNFAQLPPKLRELMLGNCDLVALFRTGARNAEHFGDFLHDYDPERDHAGSPPGRDALRRRQLEALQRLPDRTLYWYDRRQPWRALRLRASDFEGPQRQAGLASGELERLVRDEGWEQGSAAVPRDTLRAAVESRRKRLVEILHPPTRIASRGATEPPPQPKTKRRPKIG